MSWIRFAVILPLAAALSVSTRVAMADQVAEWEAMREQQQKHYDDMLANMQLLDASHTQEVMQIRMEAKSLTVRTPLPSTRGSGFVRARLQGMSQFALVRVQGGSVSRSPTETVVPANFQLNITDYSKPKQISQLAVNAQPLFFNITKSVQFPNGYQNVTILEQKSPPESGQGGMLQLVVNESSPDEQSPQNLTLDAEDFFTFVRRYPRESNRYVRPLLRELGQEDVFGPDPLIAWQVFSDLWKGDRQVAGKVTALLPDLDAADYRVRERSVTRLQSLGRDGAAVLVHLDRSALSMEQNTRIDRALAPYAQLPPKEAIRLRSEPEFLLDCLYCEDVTLRRAALQRYRDLISADARFDPDADWETRTTSIALLRQKLTTTQPTAVIK